jgi:hypothetical protein
MSVITCEGGKFSSTLDAIYRVDLNPLALRGDTVDLVSYFGSSSAV